MPVRLLITLLGTKDKIVAFDKSANWRRVEANQSVSSGSRVLALDT